MSQASNALRKSEFSTEAWSEPSQPPTYCLWLVGALMKIDRLIEGDMINHFDVVIELSN